MGTYKDNLFIFYKLKFSSCKKHMIVFRNCTIMIAPLVAGTQSVMDSSEI